MRNGNFAPRIISNIQNYDLGRFKLKERNGILKKCKTCDWIVCKLCHFNNNRKFKNKLIEFLYRLMNLILHNKMSPFSGTVKTLKHGLHLQG